MYVFECRAECRTHSSIFKVCMVLNAELNIDPTARNSRWLFSNAELNVESIARYSKCYGFECRAQCWTHSSTFKVCMVLNAKLNVDLIARYSGWIFSNAELNVEPIAWHSKCYGFDCRAECWTHSSSFKMCMVLNAKLNVDLIARYSGCLFSNAELNVEPIARYSNCVLFWMQSLTIISQLDI